LPGPPRVCSGAALALAAGLALLACARKEVGAPPAATSTGAAMAPLIAHRRGSQAAALEVSGGVYAGGPMTVGDGWSRRTFARGEIRIEVTLARQTMKPEEYESWYQQARLYPPARLPMSGDVGSGFFTCEADGRMPPCQLHGQTRDGLHIEATGNRAATRADLEDLLARLNWK
jgi:hypothetical protein